jgi:hypothetical protein
VVPFFAALDVVADDVVAVCSAGLATGNVSTDRAELPIAAMSSRPFSPS